MAERDTLARMLAGMDNPAPLDPKTAAAMNSRMVRDKLGETMPPPGIFADSYTAGLMKPVAGAAASVDFWNHPGTSMGERFRGGMDAYQDALDKEYEEAPWWSSVPQSVAGGIVGGPTKMLSGAIYDAGTGGMPALLDEEATWGDAGSSAATNTLLGAFFNKFGGKGLATAPLGLVPSGSSQAAEESPASLLGAQAGALVGRR